MLLFKCTAMDDLDDYQDPSSLVDDLLDRPDLLPASAPSITAHPKWVRLFALDQGAPGHDQYCYVLPNGLCVVGLAPSHAWLRRAARQHAASAQPASDQAQQAAHLTTQSQQGEEESQPSDLTPASGSPAKAQQAEVQAAGHTSADNSQRATDTCKRKALHGPQSSTEVGYTAKRHKSEPLSPASVPLQPDSQPAAGAESTAQQSDPAACTPSHQPVPASQDPAAVHAHEDAPSATTAAAPKADTASTDAQPAPTDAATPSTAPSQPQAKWSISFELGNRDTALKQSGKKRGQGQHMDPSSALCEITDPQGHTLRVKPVAGGKLLEVNQRLVSRPDLLLSRPCREGYLAILYPSDKLLTKLKEQLCPLPKYLELRGLTEEDLA